MTGSMGELMASEVEDGIVVDLQHRRLVEKALRRLQLTHRGAEEDDRLGLVLLQGLTDQRGLAVDLDGLLAELRRQIAADCGGWVPDMGKNRRISSVTGLPHPKSMGSGEVGNFPRPADGPGPSVALASDAGQGVRVGLLDTPLCDHPDLAGRYVAHGGALDPATDEPLPLRAGHATFVADLILRRAPAATLQVRAVLDRETGTANAWHTARAMMSFLDDEVDILNLSLGCHTLDGEPPLVLRRAIERLAPHLVVVAAAGNHGQLPGLVKGISRRSPTWPAALPQVVAVGAARPADLEPTNAGFFSPTLPWITCTAPGVGVVAAYQHALVNLPDGPERFSGYASWSGTSFAAATVSGVIAANTRPGEKTARQALDELLADGDPSGVVARYVHRS